MNTLIIGGGIGGLTAALTLSRRGHRVTLVEKTPTFAPVGAGIVLAPNASRLLESLGVSLAPRGHVLRSLDVVRADGSLLQRIDSSRFADSYGPTYALARPDLHDALVEALPPSVEVRHGASVDELSDDGRCVQARIGGGEPARYDVVIAADGLRSATREKLLGPRPYRYSGVTCYRGITKNPGIDRAIEAWGGEARVGVVPLSGDRLYYYLVHSAPQRAPALAFRQGFERVYGHIKGGLERVLSGLVEAPPLHHDLEELDEPVWGKGRVLLLGDAAHAMTPNQGQGAAMAIEDAFAAADALAQGPDGALSRYANSRQRRVRAVQLDSRRIGQVSHQKSAAVAWARDLLMRSLPSSLTDAQYRRIVEPGLALLSAP